MNCQDPQVHHRININKISTKYIDVIDMKSSTHFIYNIPDMSVT